MNTIQKLTEHCPREDCSILDHGSITTLIAWSPSYDKNGNIQGTNPNTVITRYECRMCGKQWQVSTGGRRKEEQVTLIKV
jgi:transposase-like protein